MFYLCYNILSLFLLLPVISYHLYRSLSRGRAPGFAERFGRVPQEVVTTLAGRPVIWLHAVSVGEAIAARSLLKGVREDYPDHALLVSTTTETGRGIVERDGLADAVIYFPFDFLPSVRLAIDTVKPRLVVIMETEIWPNFTRAAAKRSIPIMLANGRISDRSFDRYQRFSWFFRHPLAMFSALCMQTELDRERIVSIGAPAEQTMACGNLKYDIPYHQTSAEERRTLRRRYALPPDSLIFTAASTHPGEEEQLLAVWSQLTRGRDDLRLVLVPRHPERAAEVAALAEQSGFACRRRSLLSGNDSQLAANQVLLVDTVGELMQLYALSDLVFVGGSLVPTGGHNLLEPASLGVPSLFGPHMNNFREITALTLQYGAGVQVAGQAELLEAASDFLASAELRQVIGQNGMTLLAAAGGATERHLRVLAEVLHR